MCVYCCYCCSCLLVFTFEFCSYWKNSENIWEEIGQDLECSNPCHSLLAMVHLLVSNKKNTMEEDGLNQSAAAASLYLLLQRCPGARSRGMTHAITFQYTLKVMGQFTTDLENMEVMSDGERESMNEGDLVPETESSSNTRRNPRREQNNSGDYPISFEGSATRLLKEFDASMKFLPLVVNDNAENLGFVVEAFIAALGCTKLPTLSSYASSSLFNIALLSYEQAESLVFKGVMPLILGEKSAGGNYIASSAKSLRLAGMSVVNRLLNILNDELATTTALAASFLVLIEHLCHKAPEKVHI